MGKRHSHQSPPELEQTLRAISVSLHFLEQHSLLTMSQIGLVQTLQLQQLEYGLFLWDLKLISNYVSKTPSRNNLREEGFIWHMVFELSIYHISRGMAEKKGEFRGSKEVEKRKKYRKSSEQDMGPKTDPPPVTYASNQSLPITTSPKMPQCYKFFKRLVSSLHQDSCDLIISGNPFTDTQKCAL